MYLHLETMLKVYGPNTLRNKTALENKQHIRRVPCPNFYISSSGLTVWTGLFCSDGRPEVCRRSVNSRCHFSFGSYFKIFTTGSWWHKKNSKSYGEFIVCRLSAEVSHYRYVIFSPLSFRIYCVFMKWKGLEVCKVS